MTHLDINFEEYFRMYFEEKLQLRLPEIETDELNPATHLLEKLRELADVEKALETEKEEFQLKMESLSQRREVLEHKESQLKEAFLKFDKFLKDNDVKKMRAINKANEEKELKKIKHKELGRLNEEIHEYDRRREDLNNKLEKLVPYHQFMEKIMESTDEFKEKREIIARYETLVSVIDYLLERERKNQDTVELKRGLLMKFTEENDSAILGYNNTLADLQSHLDKAQSKAFQWESKWSHIKNTAAKKTLILGTIKLTIHNLYQVINKYLTTQVYTDDTNEQLIQIQQFVEDLSDVINDTKKHEMNASIL